ncbi:unnamed protein product, partial [Urochloa humidicola]
SNPRWTSALIHWWRNIGKGSAIGGGAREAKGSARFLVLEELREAKHFLAGEAHGAEALEVE